MRDIAGQALAFVQDLVTALLNFHTYTEQRIQIFPIDSAIDTISPLNQKVNLTQGMCSLPRTSRKTCSFFSDHYYASAKCYGGRGRKIEFTVFNLKIKCGKHGDS